MGSNLFSFSFSAARHCFLAFARQKSKYQISKSKITAFEFGTLELF